ncbi:uncharacterized protein [Watersipora subatra]|uniref:uncharacterized protein n=1 Tax=Watersipora subatra TaxID=2589382 RepID=UPI00355C5E05
MAAQNLVVSVLLLLSLSAAYSYVYLTTNEVCRNNTGYTEWKNMACERCSCGDDTLMSCAGCGTIHIVLTQEQIDRGCEVKQVERTPDLRYPECCRKYIHCPE